MLLGFGLSHYYFNRANISASTPLAYPVMAYLLVRALMIGFRPRKRPGPLLPVIPVDWLFAGLMAHANDEPRTGSSAGAVTTCGAFDAGGYSGDGNTGHRSKT